MQTNLALHILPHLQGALGKPRLIRFWSKVDIRGPDECWEWQAGSNKKGYGRFTLVSYMTVTASRFALVATAGREPHGMLALHHCDNPCCCNPHHLYFGTHADNSDDKVRRGRAKTGDQRGASNGAAKINDEQLALIVSRLKEGWNNKQIAADLPIDHSMVSLIRLGKQWSVQSATLGWEPKAQFIRRAADRLPA